MDVEFLLKIVLSDDGTMFPNAEKALWELMFPFSYPKYESASRKPFRFSVPRINDPQGIISSLYDMRSGPGMRNSYA